MNQSKRWPSRPIWGRSIPAVFLPSLLAILLLAGVAPLQAAVPEHGIALQEGVVIAPQQGFAYLMRPGGIDAVDLSTGALRWHSKGAAKPLALAGDRLVAQADSRGANALKLVVLDARSGAARDSVRIPLPAGIAATVTDTPGASFRVRADSAGASKLVVHWQATKSAGADPLQGYLPAEGDGQSPAKALAPKIVSGQAEIDLGAALKMNASPAEGSAAEARDALQELRTPAVAAEGRQLLSADGRHVLVTEPIDTAELTLYRHRWTVYDRESGAKLGSVASMVSATPFLVVGTTLYYREPSHGTVQKGRFLEAPAALRAVNLQTGAEMWKSAISETAFQGPFPP